jgi:hypothetical protein
MNSIFSYNQLLNESVTLTPNQVARYIKDNTPERDNIPHYYLEMIKRSGKKFELKKVKISDLINSDASLKEYIIDNGESHRYNNDSDDESDHIPQPEDLDLPIVILNGEVLDGYSRANEHYYNGDDEISAYVA